MIKLERDSAVAVLAEDWLLVLDHVNVLASESAEFPTPLEVLEEEQTALSQHNNAFPCLCARQLQRISEVIRESVPNIEDDADQLEP